MTILEPILAWLLEPDNPSVRYRTLTELLGYEPGNRECIETREQIAGSPAAQALFAAMRPDGSFSPGRVTHETHYQAVLKGMLYLGYLAELALPLTDERLQRAVEYYFTLQQADGDFLSHYSCVFGKVLRIMVRLGYAGDARVEKIKTLLLNSQRHDGGYLCDIRERLRRGAPRKSCIRGAVGALVGFAELPEYWDTPQCRALIDYFMRREVCFRTKDMTTLLPDMDSITFPLSRVKADLLSTLVGLSRLGCGNRPEAARAWELLERHRDAQGRYILTKAPALSQLREVAKGKPSKWATFYACYAYQQRQDKIS